MTVSAALEAYLDLLSQRGATVAKRLSPPATSQVIAAAETTVGPLPPDLTKLWGLHNGSSAPLARDAVLCSPYLFSSITEALQFRIDRSFPENLYVDFDWTDELDRFGVCLPVFQYDDLSLMVEVGNPSGEVLQWDPWVTEGLLTRTGLDLAGLFDLHRQCLRDGWTTVENGYLTFPPVYPDVTPPNVEPRLLGLHAWEPGKRSLPPAPD